MAQIYTSPVNERQGLIKKPNHSTIHFSSSPKHQSNNSSKQQHGHFQEHIFLSPRLRKMSGIWEETVLLSGLNNVDLLATTIHSPAWKTEMRTSPVHHWIYITPCPFWISRFFKNWGCTVPRWSFKSLSHFQEHCLQLLHAVTLVLCAILRNSWRWY